MPTTRLLIKGKVQGVFYRASAKDMADEIGITGWVRNTNGGDVEVLVTGTTEKIEQFVNWCRVGPKKAIVTELIITEAPGESFSQFLVKR